jgi:hypothetical protein
MSSPVVFSAAATNLIRSNLLTHRPPRPSTISAPDGSQDGVFDMTGGETVMSAGIARLGVLVALHHVN